MSLSSEEKDWILKALDIAYEDDDAPIFNVDDPERVIQRLELLKQKIEGPLLDHNTVRCRIDVLPDVPGGQIREGVEMVDLAHVPLPGLTLIIKDKATKQERIYGVIAQNIVVYEDGSQIVGLGCRKHSSILAVPAAAINGLKML